MVYDVDTPRQRFNTEISREYYRKYRPEPEHHTIWTHWSILKGEDSDIVRKTASGTVYGSIAGGVACIHSSVQHIKGPYSVAVVAAQCAKHGTPWIVMGATYGVTLSLVTQLRHKESPANHMIAGYAAGTMLGSWYKWPMLGVWSGGLMAIAAGFLKYFHDNDLLDDMRLKRQRVFNMYRQNWFMERPDAEGRNDAEIDVSFRSYRP